jgi:hypothetical protein
MSKNTLLLSATILKDRTAIHTNIDEKLLYPEIKAAEDMFIHPILGTALYNKLISDIDSTGTTTGAYKTLLDDYILDTLINYVIAALPDAISFQFWNKGVLRKGGDTTETPTMAELVDIADKYRVRAEWYAQRLIKYLQTVATSVVLPEYIDPGSAIDTIVPEVNSFTMPIYLGGKDCMHLDKNNCNCNA